MVEILSEASNEMSWVSKSQAAFTNVHIKVVEVGKVLFCILTWVVVEVARLPSWEIVVVAKSSDEQLFGP